MCGGSGTSSRCVAIPLWTKTFLNTRVCSDAPWYLSAYSKKAPIPSGYRNNRPQPANVSVSYSTGNASRHAVGCGLQSPKVILPIQDKMYEYGSKSHPLWQIKSVTAQWKMPAYSHSGLALEKVKGLLYYIATREAPTFLIP